MTFGQKMALRLSAPINTAAIIIMGVYTMAWGLWLLSPFWSVFAESKQYSWLAAIAIEQAWGAVAFVVGLTMTIGVLKNSFCSLSIGSFVGALYWGLIAMGYFIGDWKDTAGLTKTMVCLYCSFVFLNIRMNKDRLVE